MTLLSAVKRAVGVLFFYGTNNLNIRYHFRLPRIASAVEHVRCTGIRLMGASIGKKSFIRAGLFITSPKHLKMGNNSKIGIRSQLFLYTDFVIGDNVEIGSGLIVHTAEHSFDEPSRPLCKQGSVYKAVSLGSDIYIGSRVTLLPGITVEDRVVIAAGAVVASNLKTGFIYGGVPAKPIKKIPAMFIE